MVLAPAPYSLLSCPCLGLLSPGWCRSNILLLCAPDSICSASLEHTFPSLHALLLPKTHSWLSNSSLLSTVHGKGPASNWNEVQQQLWALLLHPPSTSHSPSTVQAKFVHLFLLDFGFNKSYKIILFGLFQCVDTSSCPFAASVCTLLALAWAAVGS